ncbi:MAG: outer membrane protein assembly factor BamA [Proteobacteria bacterium]|nr:outer membrane protein assembly factor BamA [Pseudomonadota bacterium]
MRSLQILLTITIIIFSLSVWANDTDKIIKIDVTGNERIDKGFITNNIKIKENDPFDLDKIREDMKNIYKTGFFSDVQIDVKETDKGKIITFVVIERAPIKAIYVSGNKKISTGDIRDKLKVKTGTVLNIEKIKESMDEIKKLYAGKGYYAAKVEYGIDYEEAYDATVKFYIEEPEKAFVRKITFTGNKAFKGDKLKGYMRVSEKGMFSWFTGSGILDEETLEEDRKNIEAFYSDNGYVRAKVGVPDIKISKDGKTISIAMSVDEGNIYKIGTVDFTGDVIFERENLLRNLKGKSGNTFRSSIFHEDVLMLTDLYQDKGYAFCDIGPLTLIDDDAKRVNITFDFAIGQEIYFNRINILGNTKTRDKVIRRELRVAEGDRFSATKLKDSKKRLTNTTFFQNIDMKIIKTDEPDKINLDLMVEEKPTGSLSIGIGYSSEEQVMLTGSISQENLLGTGRKLLFTTGFSAISQEFTLSYLEPYIFDMNLDTGLSAFNYERYMDTYEYKKTGGSVTLIRPLTDDVRGAVKYRYETTDVTNIEDAASIYIKEQEGTKITSSVMLSLTKNTIDNILNPSTGVNSGISFEVAGGPFSGDNYFYRAIAFYGKYIPAGFWDTTFFLKGAIGTIRTYGGKTLPIYEKFFVGGINTIRGFRYGEAGPKDEWDEVIGGENQLIFNTEWIFPIYKPAGIKGVIFFDAGHGFDDTQGFILKDMKASAGLGLRWFSPMGPIRLEIGFNLFPKKDEKKNVFDFTIGTQY